jgi:hypothetical protein
LLLDHLRLVFPFSLNELKLTPRNFNSKINLVIRDNPPWLP